MKEVQAVMEEMADREQKFLLKIEKKLEATTDKLKEICEIFSKRVTSVEEKVPSLEKTVGKKEIYLKSPWKESSRVNDR